MYDVIKKFTEKNTHEAINQDIQRMRKKATALVEGDQRHFMILGDPKFGQRILDQSYSIGKHPGMCLRAKLKEINERTLGYDATDYHLEVKEHVERVTSRIKDEPVRMRVQHVFNHIVQQCKGKMSNIKLTIQDMSSVMRVIENSMSRHLVILEGKNVASNKIGMILHQFATRYVNEAGKATYENRGSQAIQDAS